MITKKHLSFKALVKGFIQSWPGQKDTRKINNTKYSLQDALLSGLACMFYKSGSMLQFQERMQKRCHRNNLQTQFEVKQTPKDNCMRELIGSVDSESLAPVFKEYLTRLQRNNYLKKFQFQGRYLLTLDGVQYYSSKDIDCPKCLETETKGVLTYSHKTVQPIISHPDMRQILPMMPEEVCHHDGDTKQDCETNAAKRLIDKLRINHPRMRVIYMGDALYANTPYITKIREADDNFIFRVKQGSHSLLYKEFENAELKTLETINKKGSRLVHKWLANVPLHTNSDILVTVMRLYVVSSKKNGTQHSQLVGTWATDLEVTVDNVAEMVKAARARWKIENEAFNCLKNDGYNIAHNWGHVNGESFNFYILTLLSFYMHQILELSDALFQHCRKRASAGFALWEELRVLFNRVLYDSWEALLYDFLAGFADPDPPPPKI